MANTYQTGCTGPVGRGGSWCCQCFTFLSSMALAEYHFTPPASEPGPAKNRELGVGIKNA